MSAHFDIMQVLTSVSSVLHGRADLTLLKHLIQDLQLNKLRSIRILEDNKYFGLCRSEYTVEHLGILLKEVGKEELKDDTAGCIVYQIKEKPTQLRIAPKPICVICRMADAKENKPYCMAASCKNKHKQQKANK